MNKDNPGNHQFRYYIDYAGVWRVDEWIKYLTGPRWTEVNWFTSERFAKEYIERRQRKVEYRYL